VVPKPENSSAFIFEEIHKPSKIFLIISVCGTASTAGFIYGLRVAWIHSRLKPGELPRTNLLSGAGFL